MPSNYSSKYLYKVYTFPDIEFVYILQFWLLCWYKRLHIFQALTHPLTQTTDIADTAYSVIYQPVLAAD